MAFVCFCRLKQLEEHNRKVKRIIDSWKNKSFTMVRGFREWRYYTSQHKEAKRVSAAVDNVIDRTDTLFKRLVFRGWRLQSQFAGRR